MKDIIPPSQNEIVEAKRFLAMLAATLMQQDFEAYCDMIDTPFIVTTRHARFVYHSREELRSGYDTWQRTIKANAATTLLHKVREVDRLGDSALIVDYDTTLMAGRTRAMPSFKNLVFLRRHGRQLKLEQLLSGVANARKSLFIKVDPRGNTPLPLDPKD